MLSLVVIAAFPQHPVIAIVGLMVWGGVAVGAAVLLSVGYRNVAGADGRKTIEPDPEATG